MPPKPARQGERQPKFHGIDPAYTKWIRQARRLNNFSRLVSNASPSRTQIVHMQKLWKSIVEASGFTYGFLPWWNTTGGHWAVLTYAMPSHRTAAVVAHQFEEQLEQMERALNQHRAAKAKQRRSEDPHVIFRDLKKEAPKPCTTLLHNTIAKVIESDIDDYSITVAPANQWKADVRLTTNTGEATILHAEEDKLWLDRPPVDLVGTQVKQDMYIGQVTHMFHEFQAEWTKRWDRHLHVDESYWQPIEEFVHMAFPAIPTLAYHPITVREWRQTLKRRAAIGPDGVAREDLLRMANSLTKQLLDIFSVIEKGHQWPSQLVQGWVNCP